MLNKAFRNIFLFLIGGGAYITIEMVWRAIMNSSPTHFAMFIIGGLAFILIGGVNEWISWDMAFWKQCLFGTVFVSNSDYIYGTILTYHLISLVKYVLNLQPRGICYLALVLC